jgi:hypothetical protein
VFLLNDRFDTGGSHKLQLFATGFTVERIDEQVQVVHLVDFLQEQVNVVKELFWINVVNQVDVDLVLAQ